MLKFVATQIVFHSAVSMGLVGGRTANAQAQGPCAEMSHKDSDGLRERVISMARMRLWYFIRTNKKGETVRDAQKGARSGWTPNARRRRQTPDRRKSKGNQMGDEARPDKGDPTPRGYRSDIVAR